MEGESKSLLPISNKAKSEKIIIGVNWGRIKKEDFLSKIGFSRYEDSDIDLSVCLFDEKKQLLDIIDANKLVTHFGSIKHFGDDKSGDKKEDNKDNESVAIVLTGVKTEVSSVYFVLTLNGTNINKVPYIGLRVYDGCINEPNNVYFEEKLEGQNFKNSAESLVIVAFHRNEGVWYLEVINEAIKAKTPHQIANYISLNN